MSNQDQQHIQTLVSDLTPTKRPFPPDAIAMIWLMLSAVYAGAITLLLGPIRPGAIDQMLSGGLFTLEVASGAFCIIMLALAAMRCAVPGAPVRILIWAGAISGVLWIGHWLAGPWVQVLEPSMLGKREHCAWEAYLASVPPLIAGLWLQARRFVLQPQAAAVLIALGAGFIPTWIMQLACMYEPLHILKFHLLPALILALTTSAALAIYLALKQRG